jgi:hypothetical protein
MRSAACAAHSSASRATPAHSGITSYLPQLARQLRPHLSEHCFDKRSHHEWHAARTTSTLGCCGSVAGSGAETGSAPSASEVAADCGAAGTGSTAGSGEGSGAVAGELWRWPPHATTHAATRQAPDGPQRCLDDIGSTA